MREADDIQEERKVQRVYRFSPELEKKGKTWMLLESLTVLFSAHRLAIARAERFFHYIGSQHFTSGCGSSQWLFIASRVYK